MGRRTENAADMLKSALAYEKEFAALGLSNKARFTLIYLGSQPSGEATLLDIRKECELSTSLATYVCDALIEADLIVRLRPCKGRPTSLLRLTTWGSSVLDGLAAHFKRA